MISQVIVRALWWFVTAFIASVAVGLGAAAVQSAIDKDSNGRQ